MSLLPTIGAIDQDTGFYNGVATQSLRFDDGSSTELSRTFVTPTNQNRWTLNVWVKVTTLGARRVIIGMPYLDTEECFIGFDSDDKLEWLQYSSGGLTEVNDLTTTQVFRDTSSWYNIHAIFDSAGSGDDRQQLWVNGVKITSYSTEARSAEDSVWNQAKLHYFGNRNDRASDYFDGYMSEINFVDGLALDPSYFGETKNGVWIAKNPVVSDYGNNGFRLQFKNTGTGTTSQGTTATTNIGDDSSGSGHNFAVSGLSAHDSNMLDSPENNFCTLNTLQISNNDSNFFPSEGNLKLSANSNSGYRNCSSTFSPMGFKGYFEFTGLSTMNFYLGPIEDTTHPTNQDYADGNHNFLMFISDGQVQKNQGGTAGQAVRSASDHNLGTIATGDVLGLAFDFTGTNRNVWLHRANTYGTASGGVGNPATGANPVGTSSILDSTRPYRFHFGINNGARLHFNFGQDSSFGGNETAQGNTDENGNGDFYYTPPSGFLALCSANLPEPTIGPNSGTNEQADDYFKPVIYSGLNNTAQDITVGLVPDWVWIKTRNASISHMLFDSVRGATKWLQIDAEGTETTGSDSLTDFDVSGGGFSLGADTSTTAVNNNGKTYVSYNWKLGGAPTATNSAGAGATPTADSVKIDGANLGSALAGSIPATKISASTVSGVSIVTYTGTGSAGTVAHGLGAVPKFYIVKCLDNSASSDHWYTYHGEIASNSEDWESYANLALQWYENGNYPWNETKPTDSVFSIKTIQDVNESGKKYVAYVFADVEGFSKHGSYTGNNSTNGTFVFTGFRPSFVLTKSKNAGNWYLNDTGRYTINPTGGHLYVDLPNAESGTAIDILSNGFKIRNADGSQNASGVLMVYIAFAESPFKYANAR